MVEAKAACPTNVVELCKLIAAAIRGEQSKEYYLSPIYLKNKTPGVGKTTTLDTIRFCLDGKGLTTKIQTTKGKAIPVTNIFKSDQIKNTDVSSDSGESTFAKFWNLGNVLECIMGAAVTAKFLNPKTIVEWKDIVNILKQVQPVTPDSDEKDKTGKLVSYSMNTSVGNDKLNFIMSLNVIDLKALTMSYNNPNLLQKYPGHTEIFKAYNNAANYVNTADTVKTAIDRVISDQKENSIIIESEGASKDKQTSTKAKRKQHNNAERRYQKTEK
jgi:hypothetical protein